MRRQEGGLGLFCGQLAVLFLVDSITVCLWCLSGLRDTGHRRGIGCSVWHGALDRGGSTVGQRSGAFGRSLAHQVGGRCNCGVGGILKGVLARKGDRQQTEAHGIVPVCTFTQVRRARLSCDRTCERGSRRERESSVHSRARNSQQRNLCSPAASAHLPRPHRDDRGRDRDQTCCVAVVGMLGVGRRLKTTPRPSKGTGPVGPGEVNARDATSVWRRAKRAPQGRLVRRIREDAKRERGREGEREKEQSRLVVDRGSRERREVVLRIN